MNNNEISNIDSTEPSIEVEQENLETTQNVEDEELAKAKKFGYREDYEGEGKLSPKEFNKIGALKYETKQLKRQLSEIQEKSIQTEQSYRKFYEREFEKAKADLLKEQKAIIADYNLDDSEKMKAIDKIEERREELNREQLDFQKERQPNVNTNIPPEITAWEQKNKWIRNEHSQKSKFALREFNLILADNPYLSNSEKLEMLDRSIAKEYGETEKKQAAKPKHTYVDNASPTKSNKRYKSLDSLDPELQAAAKRVVGIDPSFPTIESYLEAVRRVEKKQEGTFYKNYNK